MREECTSFAEKLTSLFSDIVLKTLTVQLLRDFEELDITVPQLQGLTSIAEKGHCTVGELAERLGVSHVAAVKLVERLLKRELVTRKQSERDHRQSLLQATAEGRRLVIAVRSERTQRLAVVLEKMSPEERMGLIRGLERFVQAASADGRMLDSICLSCQTLLPSDCKDWIPEDAVRETAKLGGLPAGHGA
jgi:MarR family transcriptional regulator, organic hydroperoxide resistance regulator